MSSGNDGTTGSIPASRRARRAHPHSELYVHSRTGEVIRVDCGCLIGRDHGYEEWVAKIGASDQRRRNTASVLAVQGRTAG